MPATNAVTAEQKVADAMRRVASILSKQWDKGERSSVIDLDDLTEAFLTIADEIDPQ